MYRILFVMSLLVGVGVLSGCASIVSDTDSTTYIETTPEKCHCTLHGQDFKRVVNTPDSVHLPSEAAPIIISCEAEGYRTNSTELDTEVDGWIFGNIIFGGIIGAVVDASRGAGMEYPDKITLQLDPIYFETAEKRDAYYDQRETVVRKLYDDRIGKVERRYRDKENADRRARLVEKLEDARDEELRRLGEDRRTSVVGTADPVQPAPQAGTVAPPQPAGQAAEDDQLPGSANTASYP